MKYLSVLLTVFCLSLNLIFPAKAEVRPSHEFSLASDATEIYRLSLAEPPFSNETAQIKLVQYSESTWLGSLVPGFGQLLLDEPLRGLLFLGGFLASVPVSFLLGMGISNFTTPNATFLKGMNESIFVMWVLVPGMYIWNLADAYGLNIEKNKAAARSQSLSLGADGQLIWKVSVF
ncbi:MAG: hypothetical protein AB7I41_23780 [Candidatus Sericytochromatia bacterium]